MNKAISPLDGRYGEQLAHLGDYFSEFALMRVRCDIELLYAEALCEAGLFDTFTDEELAKVWIARESFTWEDFRRIKEIEKVVAHDVKACEIFLREKTGLRYPNVIHFGLTSEDVNNLAYGLLFKQFLVEVQLPLVERTIRVLCDKAEAWIRVPLPTRTHGQLASPSLLGKELSVFVARLLRQRRRLREVRIRGKLNGATGNYSSMVAAFPDFDWLGFAREFIDRLGLLPNVVTTQIEDHDSWAEWFSVVRQLNGILIDLDRDMWHYLMLEYVKSVPPAESVGSSTMPHKVNPIHFENSEGNLELSSRLLDFFIDKLSHSRMQRDLSDSTVIRNIGVAMSHAYLGFTETIRGMEVLSANEARCREELSACPELLAEPIQTILKAEEVEDPYTLLKDLVRGKEITHADLVRFVDGLDVHEEAKDRIKELSVDEYVGLAGLIADMVLIQAKTELAEGES
jgi:adenylosuccinate lyase